MSLSSILNKNLFRLASGKAILGESINSWKSSTTLEERLIKESQILSTIKLFEDNEIPRIEVSEFISPDLQYFRSTYDLVKNFGLGIRAKHQVLTDLFLDKFNNTEILINDLNSQVRRIKQKQAILDLTNSKFNKFVTGTKFLSLNKLDYNLVTGTHAELDVAAGVLHLPVTNRQKIVANKVFINSKSNGNPGSSDAEINSSNQNLTDILSTNESSFFYEKLHTGPCQLALTFEFNKTVLLNQIILNMDFLDDLPHPEIVGINFTTNNGYQLSYKDLTSHSIESNSKAEELFSILFPPVEVVALTINLKQSHYQLITTSNNISVKQFPIVIRSVEFNQNQYSSTGSINSRLVSLPKNVFALEPVIDVYPSTNNFFDILVEVSFDGGSTWTTVATEDIAKINLVDGRDFVWRASVTRVDSAFDTYSSFLPDTVTSNVYKLIQRTVSKNHSPYTIALSSKPKSQEDIYFYQPKIMTRGYKQDAIYLGEITDLSTRVNFPLVINNYSELNKVQIVVGGNLLAQKTPGVGLSSLEYSFSDDFKEILLDPEMPKGTKIFGFMYPEELLLTDTSTGLESEFNYPLDPDKDTIKLVTTEAKSIRKTMLIPNDQLIVNLGVNFIVDESFQFVVENDTWTELADREDLSLTSNSYYLDASNGILYLSNLSNGASISVSFNFYQTKELNEGQFKILYKDGTPIGVTINKDALVLKEIDERVSDSLLPIANPFDQTVEARPTIVSSNSKVKQLSFNSIVKNSVHTSSLLATGLLPEEVEFIDGKTEFLGLERIENEFTNEIVADSNGNVSFYLSARGAWYQPIGVSFASSTFSTKVAVGTSLSVGEYYIRPDGQVTVNVGSGNRLSSGINYSYYYVAQMEDPEAKISIDYRNGILYSYGDLNSAGRIRYCVCPVLASYSIAKKLKFDYDKTVNQISFNTARLSIANNIVKAHWAEVPYDLSPSKIKENFTPILSSIGFRFN